MCRGICLRVYVHLQVQPSSGISLSPVWTCGIYVDGSSSCRGERVLWGRVPCMYQPCMYQPCGAGQMGMWRVSVTWLVVPLTHTCSACSCRAAAAALQPGPVHPPAAVACSIPLSLGPPAIMAWPGPHPPALLPPPPGVSPSGDSEAEGQQITLSPSPAQASEAPSGSAGAGAENTTAAATTPETTTTTTEAGTRERESRPLPSDGTLPSSSEAHVRVHGGGHAMIGSTMQRHHAAAIMVPLQSCPLELRR